MKKLCFYIFLLSVTMAFSQEPPKPTLIDEFEEECVESVLARRDAFFNALGHTSGSHGVIIVYGIQELEGRNAKIEAYYSNLNSLARKHLNSTIRVIRGKNKDALKVQFWLVPAGSSDPQPSEPYKTETYEATKLFDRSWADFHRWDGPLNIYSDSFYDLGCWFSPNRGILANHLKNDSALKVHLVGYSGSETTASRARKVLNFAINDLVRNYKISRRRITTSYGGKREEPQIEFFLVPKGGRVPIPSPDPKRGVR